MSNATFHNFTDEAFTGYWDGRPKTFKPGERMLMPAWLAEHFAKHLTNRELLKEGKDTSTSPKKPDEVPEFMNIFNKAFIPDKPVAGANEIDDIIASAAVEPSMNIDVVQPNTVDRTSPAAHATAAEDPYEPKADEAGPGGASTVIGEASDDEGDYETGANDGGNA